MFNEVKVQHISIKIYLKYSLCIICIFGIITDAFHVCVTLVLFHAAGKGGA